MLSYFGCDQSQVQRYLTAKSIDEGRSSLLMSAYWKIPLQVLVLMVGVFTFVFYTFHHRRCCSTRSTSATCARAPGRRVPGARSSSSGTRTRRGGKPPTAPGGRPTMRVRRRARARFESEDARAEACDATPPAVVRETTGDTSYDDVNYVFPTFITTALPIGLVGLWIVAIITAATDTIAAELNSLATVSVMDFYRAATSGVRRRTSTTCCVSKVATAFWGLFAGMVAVYASTPRLADRGRQPVRIVFLRIDPRRVPARLLRAARHRHRCVRRAASPAWRRSAAVAVARPDISFLWHNVIGAIGRVRRRPDDWTGHSGTDCRARRVVGRLRPHARDAGMSGGAARVRRGRGPPVARSPEPFAVAVLRADGVLIPVARYDGTVWTSMWGVLKDGAKRPATLREIPRDWLGGLDAMPTAWHLWAFDIDESAGSPFATRQAVPIGVSDVSSLDAGCPLGIGLGTNVAMASLRGASADRTRIVGIAMTSDAVRAEALTHVEPGSALGQTIVEKAASPFHRAEDDTLGRESDGLPAKPPAYAARRQVPVTWTRITRLGVAQAPSKTYYFEGRKSVRGRARHVGTCLAANERRPRDRRRRSGRGRRPGADVDGRGNRWPRFAWASGWSGSFARGDRIEPPTSSWELAGLGTPPALLLAIDAAGR